MKDEANMDVTIVIQVIVLAIYIHYQQGNDNTLNVRAYGKILKCITQMYKRNDKK